MSPHHRKKSRCSLAGFTLLELIVVMIILAIAAAVIVPQAVGTSGLEAQSAARMIMADLEYAQSQAIVTQETIEVDFSVTGNSYTVSNTSGPLIHPITKKQYVIDFDSQQGFQSVAIDSVGFGGGSKVRFDSLGAPDPDGSVTVAAGAHAYRVNVAPVSGRVSVEEVP